jgi:hypothetical protein
MPFSTKTQAEIPCTAAKVHDSGYPKTIMGCSYADVYGRYPQGGYVSENDRETAEMVTKTIASSLSPFQPLPSLTEDVRVFNTAVRGVIEAVRDRILTEEEGNAIIEMVSRALAGRRVDAEFMHLAAPSNPMIASLGVSNAK